MHSHNGEGLGSYHGAPAFMCRLSSNSQEFHREGSKTQFKPLLKRAGLPTVRFHDLRHTCATLLLGRNVNPKIVSEMLGHATIDITLDTYSHVLPSMQSEAVKAMEDALS